MAIITLSFISSDTFISAGIPQFMTIEANTPATIYFTLDGTDPDFNAPIYVDTFEMPNDVSSVVLSALAIDADGYESDVLTQLFAADFTRLDRTHNLRNEGLVVDRFDDDTNIIDGFGADGDAISFTDLTDLDLRLIHSDRGRLGIAEGTIIEIQTPAPGDTPFPFDDENFDKVSSPSDNMFNPFAQVIINDAREENAIQILNRPFGSIRNLQAEAWGQNQLSVLDPTNISGGFLRRYYNKQNNVVSSYYFDQHSCRWIIGKQELPQSVPNIGGVASGSGPFFVFHWVERGKQSGSLG